MKKIKRLFLMTIALVFALTLSACKSTEKRNTLVPMGNINTSAVVAKNGNYEINGGLFYNALRADGYNTFFNNVKEDLFSKEIADVKKEINLADNEITEYEEKLFTDFANELFETSNPDTLKALDENKLNSRIQKYIDNCMNRGVFINKNDLKYEIKDEKIVFTYIPEYLINEKVISFAMDLAAKNELDTIVDNEKIDDKDGKKVNNTNYISEENIKISYESSEMNYGTYQAIVIQFNNLSEARNVISTVEQAKGPLTESNALEFYVELYNTYYIYRDAIDPTKPFDSNTKLTKTTFTYNEDKDELSEISDSIKSIITNTLDDENNYLKQPFNQNNKYVMIYRGDINFDVNTKYNITPANEKVEWDDLKDKNETAYNEIRSEVRERLIENKCTSYAVNVLKDRIEAADIEIYEPLFEKTFEANYADQYDFLDVEKFNNDNIYKIVYNDTTYTYSVADFYAEQSALTGLAIVIEQFQYEYAYALKDLFLDEDVIDDYKEALDKDIKSFKDNKNAAFSSNLGLELYLLATYGYDNQEDVLKYNKIASNALSKYLSQTVFDEWAKLNEDGSYSHEIDYTKLNALDNILAAGNANYSSLFSINIDHILIYIDDNADGNPDNPEDFLRNFTEAQKNDFENALLELSKAIYNEANCELLTKSNDIMDILKYITGAYDRNEELFSAPGTNWSQFKKYNFILKAESLSSSGDTNQSNVGNYVKPFGDYVKNLYKAAVDNKLSISNEKSIFYFTESLDKAPATINDICATEFGYHMIVVNSYEQPDTTKKTESSDSYGYQKNFEILLNEKETDTTDDNIYVIVENTYNDKENQATMNQLFTYYVQTKKGATSTLDSSIRTVLGAMFDNAITRYSSSDFQKFLLFKEFNISTSDVTLSKQLEQYAGYLQRVSQAYDAEDKFDTWYDGSLNWARPYKK